VDTSAKVALRAQVSKTRSIRSDSELVDLGTQLARHHWNDIIDGATVTCYVATAGEPGTESLRATLKSLGLKVFLPIIKPGRELAWGLDKGPMTQNTYGIPEPAVTEFSPTYATTLIVPALAAGRDGSRLGRGGGFFDQLLSGLPEYKNGGPLRIALVFDDEVFDSVPHESHDQPVDVIVTPNAIYQVTL